MKKQYRGPAILIAFALLNILLWILFPPDSGPLQQVFSEMLASTGIVLFSWVFVLAARLKWLEPFFGGLDNMYRAHKWTALAGLGCIFAHLVSHIESEGFNPGKPLGVLAWMGMLVLIGITLVPRVPLLKKFLTLAYARWKFSHKFLGLFFLFGLAHMLLVDSLLSQSTVLYVYASGMGGIGILAYLYRLQGYTLFERRHEYQVESVRKLNGDCVEIMFSPLQNPLSYVAGQFLFVSFPKMPDLQESHPFTISSPPADEKVSLTVKACGDFTQNLYDNLQSGTTALFEGAYGEFTYVSARKKQIWIAGGIGITPFLSWIRGGLPDDLRVTLFYSVKTPQDAIFLDELRQAETRHTTLSVQSLYSREQGRLTVSAIAEELKDLREHDIYFCGPPAMLKSLRRQFRQSGIPGNQIHSEVFGLR